MVDSDIPRTIVVSNGETELIMSSCSIKRESNGCHVLLIIH